MWRFLLIVSSFLLFVWGAYSTIQWLSMQGWAQLVDGNWKIVATGKALFYYVWPVFLMGAGLGGILAFYAGLHSGTLAAKADLADKQNILTFEKQKLEAFQQQLFAGQDQQAQQFHDQETQLKVREKRLNDKEMWLQQQFGLMEKEASRLKEEQARTEARIKAAYEERDQARQRAKRLAKQRKLATSPQTDS